MPESPAARAWASVGEATEPAPLEEELARVLETGGFGAAAWARWADEVARESSAPERSAALCLIAREQGRAGDAWKHYARLVGSPPHAAALLPHLWPGVPLELRSETGGRPPALPQGVLLRPLLPEPSGTWPPELAFAALVHERREARAELRVGEARVDLTLTVEATGIKLDARLVAGDQARLRVLMPEPQGYEVEVEYIDWLRGEERHAPRELHLVPSEEPLTIFSRVRERELELPAGKVEEVPAGLRLGGLTLIDEALGEEGALLAPTAALLERLLELDVRVLGSVPAEREDGFHGVWMRLPAEADARRRRLGYLASSIEAWRLAK